MFVRQTVSSLLQSTITPLDATKSHMLRLDIVLGSWFWSCKLLQTGDTLFDNWIKVTLFLDSFHFFKGSVGADGGRGSLDTGVLFAFHITGDTQRDILTMGSKRNGFKFNYFRYGLHSQQKGGSSFYSSSGLSAYMCGFLQGTPTSSRNLKTCRPCLVATLKSLGVNVKVCLFVSLCRSLVLIHHAPCEPWVQDKG